MMNAIHRRSTVSTMRRGAAATVQRHWLSTMTAASNGTGTSGAPRPGPLRRFAKPRVSKRVKEAAKAANNAQPSTTTTTSTSTSTAPAAAAASKTTTAAIRTQPTNGATPVTAVHKFGGSSMGNASTIEKCGAILLDRVHNDTAFPVCVVSAMYGVTNQLEAAYSAVQKPDQHTVLQRVHDELASMHLEAARSLIDTQAGRAEYEEHLLQSLDEALLQPGHQLQRAARGDASLSESDHLTMHATMTSLGETLASHLFASHLSGMVPSQAVRGDDVVRARKADDGGMRVMLDNTTSLVQQQIVPLVDRGCVPVVAGFVCRDNQGRRRTLGRSGSDYSATILGRTLQAYKVVLWKAECNKTADGKFLEWQPRDEQLKWIGLLSIDPRVGVTPIKVPVLTYAEAATLSEYGREVLHPSSMSVLLGEEQSNPVPVFVSNSACPDVPGTVICSADDINDAEPVDKDSAASAAASATTVSASTASATEVSADTSTDSASNSDVFAIASTTIDSWAGRQRVDDELTSEAENLAVVALIGESLYGASMAANLLDQAGIEVLDRVQGEHQVSFIVDHSHEAAAVQQLHRAYFA
eukprot:TRINITY_DN65739_c3_g1_i1.p1 TRINITY_DN65739_c3_g1~~TRINITY_DN65739_c3_g1_i1.p1  ORF type:complete len:584 (+),score=292.41 TRINITY_DN65739_c3_g1_i1:281-2032(+)